MKNIAPEQLFSGGVYTPSDPNLPVLVILFREGKYVAHKEVQSVAEGEAALAQALTTLPTLEDPAGE